MVKTRVLIDFLYKTKTQTTKKKTMVREMDDILLTVCVGSFIQIGDNISLRVQSIRVNIPDKFKPEDVVNNIYSEINCYGVKEIRLFTELFEKSGFKEID